MATTKGGPDLYLHVWAEEKDGYFHIYARPVERDAKEDYPRGHSRDDLADLRVTSQAGGQAATVRERRLYAWAVAYQSRYRVELADAEGMVKVLKAVDRSLTKENARDGYADSFASFVLRVGRALGVRGYVVQYSAEAEARGGARWRWINAADAHSWIKQREAEYAARYETANA